MLGAKGYSSLKLSDFKKRFKDRYWLSFKKGEKRDRIRVDVYLYDNEYYN